MQKFMPQSLVRISRNGRSRSTQLGPKLMFSCVSFRLGAFGTIMLLHKLDAKRAKLAQLKPKFVSRCLVRNFRNDRSQSTPLEPNSCFGVFLSIWVHLGPFPYCTKLAAKRAKLWCKSSCPEVKSEFFAMNTPDPHHWTLNTCFGVFLSVWGAFGTILLLHETCCKMRRTSAINAKVRATMSC